MNFMSRTLITLFVFTALLSTITSLSVEWLFELGALTDQFGNRISLLDLQRKRERISHEIQVSLEHVRSKDAVAEALNRGEIGLIEAAAVYRALNEDPKWWHLPHRPQPAHEDGETWCREVIEWTDTKVRIEQSPGQADAVRQRLEAELQQQLTYHGTVKLPD